MNLHTIVSLVISHSVRMASITKLPSSGQRVRTLSRALSRHRRWAGRRGPCRHLLPIWPMIPDLCCQCAGDSGSSPFTGETYFFDRLAEFLTHDADDEIPKPINRPIAFAAMRCSGRLKLHGHFFGPANEERRYISGLAIQANGPQPRQQFLEENLHFQLRQMHPQTQMRSKPK